MSTNLEKTLGAPHTVQIARSPQNQHDPPPIANIKAAKDCFVLNCHGRKIPFPALYEKTKTILVFLRVREPEEC